MRHATIFLTLLFAPAACDSSPKSAPASSATGVPLEQVQSNRPASTTTSEPCAHTGLWAECTVERRLKQSGFVVKKLDEHPKRAGFDVEPVVYQLGSARLEVFLYRDAESLAAAMSRLDTLTASPIGTTGSWETTPLLIRSGNLAAVFVGGSPRQGERAMLALTAGAPQPGSPR